MERAVRLMREGERERERERERYHILSLFVVQIFVIHFGDQITIESPED